MIEGPERPELAALAAFKPAAVEDLVSPGFTAPTTIPTPIRPTSNHWNYGFR